MLDADHFTTYSDFQKIEMRVGTILRAEIFPEARNPSYKLWIDFGELGEKKSSAQLSALYSAAELPGKQVIAVTNFPPKQIANFMSEVLVLGAVTADGKVVLLQPERPVANGTKIA